MFQGARAALAEPAFRRFFVGQTISQLGDSVFMVALAGRSSGPAASRTSASC